jgi:hypothetical protein
LFKADKIAVKASGVKQVGREREREKEVFQSFQYRVLLLAGMLQGL